MDIIDRDKIALAEAKCMNDLQTARQSKDTEYAHVLADDAITEFLRVIGYGHLVDAWDEVSKWYS